MATTIVTKYGSDAPAASDIVRGELAVDTENGRLYTENSSGAVVEIGLNPEGNVDVTGTLTASDMTLSDGTNPTLTITDTTTPTSLALTAGNLSTTIGTTTDHPLKFETNGTERLRIENDGNVGIGTASPSYALHVYETPANGAYSATTNMSPTARFHATESTTGAYTAIQLSANNANSALGWWNIGTVSTSSNYDNHLVFQSRTGASTYAERMRIDASGNVGIGTASPDSGYKLDVAGNVVFGDGGGFDMNVDGTRWQFSLGGSEKMRLDSSGNLLVGKTSDAINLAGVVNYSAGIVRASRNGNSGQFGRISTDGDIVTFYKDTVTVGSIGTFAGDLTIGDDDVGIRFDTGTGLIPWDLGANSTGGAATDGAIDIGAASARFKDLYLSGVMAAGDGSASAPSVRGTDTNTGLFFPSGGVTAITRNGVEGCRMDASGNFLVGKSSTSFGTDGFQANADGQIWATNASASVTAFNRRTTDGDISVYYKDGTAVGSISVTSSATAYNTSSDQRLKENIVDAPSASDDIDAIQVRSFDWKVNGSHQKYGMVAQELLEVAPEAVSQGETEEDMMGVDYSKLVPMLVKEIQSLRARVAQLES